MKTGKGTLDMEKLLNRGLLREQFSEIKELNCYFCICEIWNIAIFSALFLPRVFSSERLCKTTFIEFKCPITYNLHNILFLYLHKKYIFVIIILLYSYTFRELDTK